jgi:predicted RNase H-like nuclease
MLIDKHIGVDGCKAGWFFIAIGPGDELEFGIFTTIEKLWRTYSKARSILIDIPIGLPSKEIKTRPCDKAARQVLSPKRHHSIFSPPCREALTAESYRQACRINHNVCDRKISKQAWHISRKIKEVDDLMTAHPAAGDSIKETHPEICFWALANKETMVHYKKSPEGEAERFAVLKKYFEKSTAVIKSALDRYPRKQLAHDDILDALVNAVTAARLDASMETLPSEPIRDILGLPMQMVYSPCELWSK